MMFGRKKSAVNHNESMQAQYYSNARNDSKHSYTLVYIYDAHNKNQQRDVNDKKHLICECYIAQNKIKINKASDVKTSAYMPCLCVLSLIYREQTWTLSSSLPFVLSLSLSNWKIDPMPLYRLWNILCLICAWDLTTLHLHVYMKVNKIIGSVPRPNAEREEREGEKEPETKQCQTNNSNNTHGGDSKI